MLASQVFQNLLSKRTQSALDHVDITKEDYDKVIQLISKDPNFSYEIEEHDRKLQESFNMPKKVDLPKQEVKRIYIEYLKQDEEIKTRVANVNHAQT